MVYCNICSIFSSISISYCLRSCYICDRSVTCRIRCTCSACSACSAYIHTYELIVIDVCRLVSQVLTKSKLSGSVETFRTRSCRSCRCIKLSASSHLIVVDCNISCILTSVLVSYCNIISCRRIVACMTCRCCTYQVIVCEGIRCCRIR